MSEGALPAALVMAPVLLPKVWGGRRLSRFGKSLPPGEMIGESWELADLSQTSASGAGGGAVQTRIASGAHAGKTLREAAAVLGPTLFGATQPGADGSFPLLVKFLDARENLSVQVHPSPAYARTHPGAHLKTECWLVLDAEPGARIFKGVKPGVTRDAFERALRQGDGSGVVELMGHEEARVGECHLLPSGTVHALGAGVLAAEVQTPSDTTFRVYDWGRTGRALHIDEALACISFEPAREATRVAADKGRGTLCSTGYFDVELLRVKPGDKAKLSHASPRPLVVMVLEGSGAITAPGFANSSDAQESVKLGLGSTALVPAAASAEAVFVADAGREAAPGPGPGLVGVGGGGGGAQVLVASLR